MAANIANNFFARQGISAVATSCGVYASDNSPASPHADAVMADMGLGASVHKARRARREILASADYIITMTSGHKAHILTEHIEFADKTHTLADLCGTTDITDPFGGNLAVYHACAAELKHCIESLDWRNMP